jgi:hypothetical protein
MLASQSMTRHFCTYFDHRFLPRGLALHDSLQRHCSPFVLWVLCLDDLCYDALKRFELPGVHLISLSQLEQADPALLIAKGNRSLVEYYFTCTPCLPRYVLGREAGIDLITYVDADLFFFSDPTPIFNELGSASIGIVGHRFAPELSYKAIYGKYNVGILCFRRDHESARCLEWWRERCLEWCHDRVEDGRFADQKYLDEWPQRFGSVKVLEHKGVNLAPWNIANYTLTKGGGLPSADGDCLVVYHFHALNKIGRWVFDPGLNMYGAKANGLIRRSIYGPYLKVLNAKMTTAKKFLGTNGEFFSSRHVRHSGANPGNGLTILGRIMRKRRRVIEMMRGVARGRYLLNIPGFGTW